MKRTILITVLSIASLGIPGCAKSNATLPAGATAPTFTDNAANAMDGFSKVLLQAQNLFTSAQAEGLVDPSSYQAGQKVFEQVGISGQAIVAAIQAGQGQAQVVPLIEALAAQLGSMPSAFAIKNPQSQAAFTAIIQSLVNILNTTEVSIVQLQPAAK